MRRIGPYTILVDKREDSGNYLIELKINDVKQGPFIKGYKTYSNKKIPYMIVHYSDNKYHGVKYEAHMYRIVVNEYNHGVWLKGKTISV